MNNNIELQTVNYEIANTLQDIGFNIPCYWIYDRKLDAFGVKRNIHQIKSMYNYGLEDIAKDLNFIYAPEQALACRWFDKVHKIRIDVIHADSNGSYNFEIHKWNFDNCVGKWERIGNICSYDSYELAEEHGILKAIELINEK